MTCKRYIAVSLHIGPGVYESILHRKRQTRMEGYLSDITDGSLYANLEAETCISLTLNTDGVSIFKSNKMSVWPILLMINELPFVDRYKIVVICIIRIIFIS